MSEPSTAFDKRLRGGRFKPLADSEMSAAQKAMVQNLLAGPRGARTGLAGPFNVLLRSPELGDCIQKVGERIRFHSSLPARLNELAILIVAREWTAQFEWYAHHRFALEAGLDPAIAEAIAAGQRPATMRPDEAAIYDFCRELLDTRQVSDPRFAAVKGLFGERGVVDLIALLGYYHLVSMVLNVDRYPVPEGIEEPLKPLK